MDKEEALKLSELATPMYTLDAHDELYDLVASLDIKPGDVLMELGCAFGRTSIILAYIAKHRGAEFHAIDCFILSPEEEYRKALNASGLPYNLHVGLTTGVGSPNHPHLKEVSWDREIAFLFIDAAHTEPWFSADCIKYLPLLKKGGVVAFDDWADPNTEGNAHFAVAHFGQMHTEGWDDLGWYAKRLRVKRKP